MDPSGNAATSRATGPAKRFRRWPLLLLGTAVLCCAICSVALASIAVLKFELGCALKMPHTEDALNVYATVTLQAFSLVIVCLLFLRVVFKKQNMVDVIFYAALLLWWCAWGIVFLTFSHVDCEYNYLKSEAKSLNACGTGLIVCSFLAAFFCLPSVFYLFTHRKELNRDLKTCFCVDDPESTDNTLENGISENRVWKNSGTTYPPPVSEAMQRAAPTRPEASSITASTMPSTSDPVLAYISSRPPMMDATAAGKKVDKLAHVKSLQFTFSEVVINHRLGMGSFGQVFLATLHETPIALKVLLDTKSIAAQSSGPKELSQAAASAVASASPDALVEEVNIMGTLRHPNVVQFLGFCLSPPCIASEYCTRGSLYDVLTSAAADPVNARRELTWRRILDMAIGGATGMKAPQTACERGSARCCGIYNRAYTIETEQVHNASNVGVEAEVGETYNQQEIEGAIDAVPSQAQTVPTMQRDPPPPGMPTQQQQQQQQQSKNLVDLFTGSGAFMAPFIERGWKVLLAVEKDEAAQRVLKTSFGLSGDQLHNDITTLESLPQGTDLVVAGFPCQDISTLAGSERACLDGKNSRLFWEMVRLLKQYSITYPNATLPCVLIENVAALLDRVRGSPAPLSIMLDALKQVGYESFAYTLLDHRNFGGCTSRQRTFVAVSARYSAPAMLYNQINIRSETDTPAIPDEEEVIFFDLAEGRSMPSTTNVCPTLTCSNLMGKSIFVVSQQAVGYLTAECGEILHGLERGWTAGGGENTETQRCHIVGNGIPLSMSTFIAENYEAAMDGTAVVDVPQNAALLGNMKGFSNPAPIFLPRQYEEDTIEEESAAQSKRTRWFRKDVKAVAIIDIAENALPSGGICGKETDGKWREMAVDICPRIIKFIPPSAIIPYLEKKDINRAKKKFDAWHPRIAKNGLSLTPLTMAVLFRHGILKNDRAGPPATWIGKPYLYNDPVSGPMIVEEVTQLSVDCGRPIVGKDKSAWMGRGDNAFVLQLPSSERALDCKGLVVDRKELRPTTRAAIKAAMTEVIDANREGARSFNAATAEAHLMMRILRARDKMSVYGAEDPRMKLSDDDHMIIASRMTVAADSAKNIEECKECAGCKKKGTGCIFRELLTNAALGHEGAILAARRRSLVDSKICIEERGELVEYRVTNYNNKCVSHELRPVRKGAGSHQEIALWSIKGAAYLLENSPDFEVERAPKRTKI